VAIFFLTGGRPCPGGRRAAALYSLIETAKLNSLNPQAYIADVLARISDHPARRIGDLLPWHWKLAEITRAAWPGVLPERLPRDDRQHECTRRDRRAETGFGRDGHGQLPHCAVQHTQPPLFMLSPLDRRRM